MSDKRTAPVTANATPRVAPFKFRKRDQRLNWLDITSLDLDRIERENDATSLLGVLENVTYSDVQNEDFRKCKRDDFVALIRIFQMLVEYIHYGQYVLKKRRDELDTRVKELSVGTVETSRNEERLRAEVQMLESEVRNQKKAMKAMQYVIEQHNFVGLRCDYCSKNFANNGYLYRHLQKKHPKELEEDGFDVETGRSGRRGVPPTAAAAAAPASVNVAADVERVVEPLIRGVTVNTETKMNRMQEDISRQMQDRMEEIRRAVSSRPAETFDWQAFQREERNMMETKFNQMKADLLHDFQDRIGGLVQHIDSQSRAREPPRMEADDERQHPRIDEQQISRMISERLEPTQIALQRTEAELRKQRLDAENAQLALESRLREQQREADNLRCQLQEEQTRARKAQEAVSSLQSQLQSMRDMPITVPAANGEVQESSVRALIQAELDRERETARAERQRLINDLAAERRDMEERMNRKLDEYEAYLEEVGAEADELQHKLDVLEQERKDTPPAPLVQPQTSFVVTPPAAAAAAVQPKTSFVVTPPAAAAAAAAAAAPPPTVAPVNSSLSVEAFTPGVGVSGSLDEDFSAPPPAVPEPVSPSQSLEIPTAETHGLPGMPFIKSRFPHSASSIANERRAVERDLRERLQPYGPPAGDTEEKLLGTLQTLERKKRNAAFERQLGAIDEELNRLVAANPPPQRSSSAPPRTAAASSSPSPAPRRVGSGRGIGGGRPLPGLTDGDRAAPGVGLVSAAFGRGRGRGSPVLAAATDSGAGVPRIGSSTTVPTTEATSAAPAAVLAPPAVVAAPAPIQSGNASPVATSVTRIMSPSRLSPGATQPRSNDVVSLSATGGPGLGRPPVLTTATSISSSVDAVQRVGTQPGGTSSTEMAVSDITDDDL